MKALLIFVFCIVQILMNAQDTIYKRRGEIISVKVVEVGVKEISYKRRDLLDGPLFVTNKDEIKKIKYLTGSIDSFSVVKQKAQKPVYQNNTRFSFAESDLIFSSLNRGKYTYHGRTISDRHVLSLAFKKNQVWNDKDISSNIRSSRRNKNLQFIVGYAGAAVGFVALYGCALAAGESSGPNDSAIAGMVAVASAGILVSSQIVSFTYKLKRIKNADNVMELYNNHSK